MRKGVIYNCAWQRTIPHGTLHCAVYAHSPTSERQPRPAPTRPSGATSPALTRKRRHAQPDSNRQRITLTECTRANPRDVAQTSVDIRSAFASRAPTNSHHHRHDVAHTPDTAPGATNVTTRSCGKPLLCEPAPHTLVEQSRGTTQTCMTPTAMWPAREPTLAAPLIPRHAAHATTSRRTDSRMGIPIQRSNTTHDGSA